MDYISSDRRNKKKHKFKEKKRHPYKQGGAMRTFNLNDKGQNSSID